MAKNVSAVVSAAGGIAAFWTLLDKEVRMRGGDPEDMHILWQPDGEGLVGRFADLIIAEHVFTFMVNPRLSLADAIAPGNYSNTYDDWTEERCQLEKGEAELSGEVRARLICLGRVATTKEIEDHAAERKLPLAMPRTLLAFGAAFPEVQRKFPVAGLSCSWTNRGGDRVAPYLWGSAGGRRLSQDSTDPGSQWDGHVRALVLLPRK